MRGSGSVTRSGSPATNEVAVKSAPRETIEAKLQADLADQQLFTDSTATLRKVLGADAVVAVAMDEYQLYFRRNNATGEKDKREDKDMNSRLISDFLAGKDWPLDIEPVVVHVPKIQRVGAKVLGKDSEPGFDFHFDLQGADTILADYLKLYLKTRRVWWDRSDDDDDLTQQIYSLMPEQSHTTMATAFMVHNGFIRYAVFATWKKPPGAVARSSEMALPFTWIMGSCTMAATAIRKMRSLEQSQITYSNLQAQ